MELLIATRNQHKIDEFRQMLNPLGVEILGADDVPGLPEVEEDGDTFEANAAKKAVEVAKASGRWTLADDSGLEVDALEGAPGVYSARFAGEEANYADNNKLLLEKLEGVTHRTGRFCCVLALAQPHGEVHTLRGTCEGTIALAGRGDNGFGYDPLFIPEGLTQTFAELSDEEKHALSHRGQALQLALKEWATLLGVRRTTL